MHSGKLILILFTAFIFFHATGGNVYAEEAVITGSNLNIRSGPGTEYESIGSADTGQSYTVVQQMDDWVEIELPEGTGWVSAEFISVSEDSTAEPESSAVSGEEPGVSSITIQEDNTQLREGPSTEHDIIDFAAEGTEFEVISSSGDWYEVSNEEVTGFVLKDLINDSGSTDNSGFKNKTIVIDAGHGGRDVGAIGATESFEKDITYLTAHELAQELQYLGADVHLTRADDEFISLASRATYSNFVDTDAFISLHYNSVPELPNVSGIESFYYAGQNEKMAQYIQEGIIKETEVSDRGIGEGDFLVLRMNMKPSVLLELGFISNPEKEALLKTNAYQKKLVSGIVSGLGAYFDE
ncbi:N-acetylmuramoyl-L-alanine amidase [Oceanobacillus massiliensis]|uniref:N-acetylmuramoyl-L-alanine amidase n=1 Tax=Oceanobacillus massiliensis TaxID=1465765 RepID=UPI0002881486|nr:N-acetylmuramoyl-L-alanine amidase [Oceanobacillus massiliensis]